MDNDDIVVVVDEALASNDARVCADCSYHEKNGELSVCRIVPDGIMQASSVSVGIRISEILTDRIDDEDRPENLLVALDDANAGVVCLDLQYEHEGDRKQELWPVGYDSSLVKWCTLRAVDKEAEDTLE